MELLIQVTLIGVLTGGVYALLAMGFNLAFGVMGIINFAHGEFAVLGGLTAYLLFVSLGWSSLASLPLVAVLAFLVGLVVHRILIEPLIEAHEFTMVVVTFGLATVMMGLLSMMFGHQTRFVPPVVRGAVFVGPFTLSAPRLVGFAVSIVLSLALFLFLRYTRTGKQQRAVAQDRDLARVSGVPVRRIEFLTFGISIALAVVAGAILVSMFPISPSGGENLLIRTLAIAVIGGLGSFPGAFFGAILLGVAEAYTNTFLSGRWGTPMFFVALVLVLLLRPSGLWGYKHVVGR